MNCHLCGASTRVVETKGSRRRRECPNSHRFTTYERTEEAKGYRTLASAWGLAAPESTREACSCGAATRVLETRGVRRRRECENGHRFTTFEHRRMDPCPRPPVINALSPDFPASGVAGGPNRRTRSIPSASHAWRKDLWERHADNLFAQVREVEGVER